MAIAVYLVGAAILYAVGLTVYRFFFHPLRHIPGPSLAAWTYLYEYYYDMYLLGQYTWKLKELHERYGPVIRINPDDVHINDPDCYDQVYNQTNGAVDKPVRVAEMFGPYPAAIGTVSHNLHRIRRSALNPFFSRKSVIDLIPIIRRPIDMLCDRLDDALKSGEILNMKYIYAAVTLDAINDYCFSTRPQNVLKSDFGRKNVDDLDVFVKVSLMNTHMPWIMRLSNSLPDAVNRALSPAMADMLDFRDSLAEQIEAIRHGSDRSHEKSGHRTLFHELLGSKLPPQELKRDRLRDEALSLVTAGSGTVAYVLQGTAYHIAANPPVRQRLYEELKAAMPDSRDLPSLVDLERLPYLTAIINEGLRLCGPVTHRLGRQFPEKTLVCHGSVIPAGTTVSMTILLVHQNEKIFPDPQSFRPDRWLETDSKRLERYLVPFNRGTRACVGLNLAKAELYLIIASVFRRFDFDVSRVRRERDIDISHDFILAGQAHDTSGILVQVKAA